MNKNLLGCFVKICFNPNLNEFDFMELDKKFTPYIFKEKGISIYLKKLEHEKYGNDIRLILFEFNVKPTIPEIEITKNIGSYRSKEKSIGIPIIVNEENFFSKSESDRIQFLKVSILKKIDLLEEVVKKKKLDTNMSLLKADLEKVLNEWDP